MVRLTEHPLRRSISVAGIDCQWHILGRVLLDPPLFLFQTNFWLVFCLKKYVKIFTKTKTPQQVSCWGVAFFIAQ